MKLTRTKYSWTLRLGNWDITVLNTRKRDEWDWEHHSIPIPIPKWTLPVNVDTSVTSWTPGFVRRAYCYMCKGTGWVYNFEGDTKGQECPTCAGVGDVTEDGTQHGPGFYTESSEPESPEHCSYHWSPGDLDFHDNRLYPWQANEEPLHLAGHAESGLAHPLEDK